MKPIDKLIIHVFGYLAICLLLYPLSKNIPLTLLVSFLLWIAVDNLLRLLSARLRAKKKISVQEMESVFAIMGSTEQKRYFLSVVPDAYQPKEVPDGIVATKNGSTVLIVPLYKFSAIGYEDVARCFRAVNNSAIEKVFVLSKRCPKDVLLFSKKLQINIYFIPSKKVLDFLYDQNKLPENIFKKEKRFSTKHTMIKPNELLEKIQRIPEKTKGFFSSVYEDLFVKGRAKYFFIASFSLALLSLVVPWKIYYITFSIISLTLGLICVAKNTLEL